MTKKMSPLLEATIQRIHEVMDAYNIPKEQDLRFLADITYVLGYELEFSMRPVDTEEASQ